MLMVAAICFRLWTAAQRSYPMPLPSARFASRSTMRCTASRWEVSCLGVFMAALLRCKRSLMLRGCSFLGAGVSAALTAFCAFRVSASSTAARSKSSPNFRAVIGFVLSGVRYDNLPRLSLTVTPCCSSFSEKSSKERAADRAVRIVRRSFSLSVSNFVSLGGSPVAVGEAFSLSSAACPFRFAQYSRSVTRFLLPCSKSI